MMAQKTDNNPQALPEVKVTCNGGAGNYFAAKISEAMAALQDHLNIGKIVSVIVLPENCVYHGPKSSDDKLSMPAFPVMKLGAFSDCYTTLCSEDSMGKETHIFFFYQAGDTAKRIKKLRDNCNYAHRLDLTIDEDGTYVFSIPD